MEEVLSEDQVTKLAPDRPGLYGRSEGNWLNDQNCGQQGRLKVRFEMKKWPMQSMLSWTCGGSDGMHR